MKDIKIAFLKQKALKGRTHGPGGEMLSNQELGESQSDGSQGASGLSDEDEGESGDDESPHKEHNGGVDDSKDSGDSMKNRVRTPSAERKPKFDRLMDTAVEFIREVI